MRPEAWAERHDGLITNEVARRGGVSPDQMKRRRAAGRYRGVRRGVSAIAGAPPTWSQAVRAAGLAAGEEVFASHLTAARWLGAPPCGDDGSVHLTGPPARMVRMPGVTYHRMYSIESGDVITVNGMRCTSPLRTVIDLSGTLTVPALGDLLDHFLRSRRVSLEVLRERVGRVRPAPGRSVKALRTVLSQRIPGYDPGESALEARIARIIDRLGLPRPQQQHRVRIDGHRYRIDFAWPDLMVYLEGNGFGFHRLATDLDRDATRQNALVLSGWRPIEVTWRMSDEAIGSTLRRFFQPSARFPARGA